MALFTLRAAEEVRSRFGNNEGDLDTEMVAIARAIIGQGTGKFDRTRTTDRYQEALRAPIDAKLKGPPHQTSTGHLAATGDRSDDSPETESRAGNACNGCHDGQG